MNDKLIFSNLDYLRYSLIKLKNYATITEDFLKNADVVSNETSMGTINGKPVKFIMNELKNVEILNLFPHISRSSLVITICSTFEKCLYAITDEVLAQKGVEFNRKKSAHLSIFERFELFVQDAASMSLPSEQLRHRIKDLNIIRNCIVHNDGDIWDEQPKRDQLEEIIDKEAFIVYSLMDVIDETLAEKNVIMYTSGDSNEMERKKFFFLKGFCFELIDVYISYLDELFNLNQ